MAEEDVVESVQKTLIVAYIISQFGEKPIAFFF